jgi:hypothetical protein
MPCWQSALPRVVDRLCVPTYMGAFPQSEQRVRGVWGNTGSMPGNMQPDSRAAGAALPCPARQHIAATACYRTNLPKLDLGPRVTGAGYSGSSPRCARGAPPSVCSACQTWTAAPVAAQQSCMENALTSSMVPASAVTTQLAAALAAPPQAGGSCWRHGCG